MLIANAVSMSSALIHRSVSSFWAFSILTLLVKSNKTMFEQVYFLLGPGIAPVDQMQMSKHV